MCIPVSFQIYFWCPDRSRDSVCASDHLYAKNKIVLGKFCNGKVDDHCSKMAKMAPLEHKQRYIQLHHTFRFQFSHFCISVRNWGWKKFKPACCAAHVLLLDFTGGPLIPPSPLFQIELLHHSSHYDRISTNNYHHQHYTRKGKWRN